MAAEQHSGFRDKSFTLRLLHALAAGGTWQTIAGLISELWVLQANASTALVLGIETPKRFTGVCLKNRTDGTLQPADVRIDVTCSALLTSQHLLDAAATTGMLGGLHLSLRTWPELLSALVLQFPEATEQSADEQHRVLDTITYKLLSLVTDRPVTIPTPELLEAMAEYSAGAGHEINNPLASIIGQTQVLLKSESSLDRRQSLETIGAQAWRIRDMIGNSMLFARPPVLQLSRFNLIHPVQEAMEALEDLAAESGVEFRLASVSEKILITADRSQISRLLIELIRNGVEAIRGAGRSGVVAIHIHESLQGLVELTIADDGPGLAVDVARRNAFNPFYSGRSAGRGLGFGLCLAWRIVRLHRGLIFLQEGTENGTACHLALPFTPAGN